MNMSFLCKGMGIAKYHESYRCFGNTLIPPPTLTPQKENARLGIDKYSGFELPSFETGSLCLYPFGYYTRNILFKNKYSTVIAIIYLADVLGNFF